MEVTVETIRNLYLTDSYARKIFTDVAEALLTLKDMEGEILGRDGRTETNKFTRIHRVGDTKSIEACRFGDCIATIQRVKYTINRETHPIYVMGDPKPVAYSRGKRWISGELVLSSINSEGMSPGFSITIESNTGEITTLQGVTIANYGELEVGRPYIFSAGRISNEIS